MQFTLYTACSSTSYASKNKIKRTHSNDHKKSKNFNWSHTWIRKTPTHHIRIKEANKCSIIQPTSDSSSVTRPCQVHTN